MNKCHFSLTQLDKLFFFIFIVWGGGGFLISYIKWFCKWWGERNRERNERFYYINEEIEMHCEMAERCTVLGEWGDRNGLLSCSNVKIT